MRPVIRALLAVSALAVATSALVACARPADGAGTHAMTVGGLRRTYTVYRPPGRTGPLPVVLVLHGGGGDGAGMRRFSGFDAAADRYGFVAVYPDGYRRSWADGRGASAADAAGVDDVAFLGDVLDAIDRDEVRLYTVTGGGHTWPGASQYLPVAVVGRAARDFDATDVIGAFFASAG